MEMRLSILLLITWAGFGYAENASVDVIWHGADPTGLKDSTAVIQFLLDKGGTIVFPAGTYRITRTLAVTKSGTASKGNTDRSLFWPPGTCGRRSMSSYPAMRTSGSFRTSASKA